MVLYSSVITFSLGLFLISFNVFQLASKLIVSEWSFHSTGAPIPLQTQDVNWTYIKRWEDVLYNLRPVSTGPEGELRRLLSTMMIGCFVATLNPSKTKILR